MKLEEICEQMEERQAYDGLQMITTAYPELLLK